MGRSRRYRERIQYEMQSVRTKGILHHLVQILHTEFGRSRIEAEVLAARSTGWLRSLGVSQLPGQVWMSVPSTASKRYAGSRRCEVLITAVDTEEDTRIWEEFDLLAMQRHRLLRWITEIRRQGGWAALKDLAAWANMTPTALANRLRPIREMGIYLPHVGAGAPADGQRRQEPWLVQRYLKGESIESIRPVLGLTISGWERILRRFVTVLGRHRAGEALEDIAGAVGLCVEEIQELIEVGSQYSTSSSLGQLRRHYDQGEPSDFNVAIDTELIEEFGFSRVAARLYREELGRLSTRLSGRRLKTGRTVFFAISSDEGAAARLDEARLVPVELTYFDDSDRERGPDGDSPTRVSDLKFGRILRYATQARAQGALLTLPDLAVLNGIHVCAIRRQVNAHPEVVVPTRGRVKDIGRSVSHKVKIVELYLQMYTETEIVDKSGHSYESVEEYLREFARVLTLADRGMNAVMIRRVTGRSMALVQAYMDLYRKYDEPDYHFRLAQIRQVFVREEEADQKGGPTSFHTKDGLP
jgi:hypothetical protein